MSNKSIAEADFLRLEQKIIKLLELVEKLKQENQKLVEAISRMEAEKTAAVERINLMLDKIDELL